MFVTLVPDLQQTATNDYDHGMNEWKYDERL